MLAESNYQIKTPSVKKLMAIWGQRYVPNLSAAILELNNLEFLQGLAAAAGLSARRDTAAKLNREMISLRCQMASLQAKGLYACSPSAIDMDETERLSDHAFLLYLKLAEIYQCPSSRCDRTLAQIAEAHVRQPGSSASNLMGTDRGRQPGTL